MDSTQKKPNPNKHKYKLFLGCLRFSREHVLEEMVKPSKTVDTTNNMEKKPWFSLSSFHVKSSGTARTVPVDSPATSGKLNSGKKCPVLKSKVEKTKEVHSCVAKGSCKKRRKSSSDIKDEIPEANQNSPRHPPEVPPIQELHAQTQNGSEQSTILGNEKKPSHVEAREDAALQKRQAFCRKIDTIRTGTSLPVQTAKPKFNRTVTRSQSLPVNNPPTTKFRVDANKSPKENEAVTKGYDPLVGMSIIIVTLLIMLLWGRFCAILCTCAWFYFVPRLRAMVDPVDQTGKPGSALVEPDLDSEEYKRRVVLEGFLERNHRSVV